MSFLYAFLLFLVLLAAWLMTVVGMPGNWTMVVVTALYAWLAPADSVTAIGWGVVLAMAILAGIGELLEAGAGAMGVAKAGGSKRGAALALLGSMIGGIVGVVIGVPIPVVGQLVAAVLFAGFGALGGAIAGELWKGRQLEQSWEIGKGAFWGRLLGTAAKIMIGSIMLAVATVAMVV